MVSPASAGLSAAVGRLRDEADDVRLPLDLPGADEARHARRELVAQLDDYLLPRLRHPEAPLLAVVGGSTGAGRSTLVNSLVGREVTPAGVLRPTTRVPVLVCRAADRRWFAGTRVLPGLRRVASATRDAEEGPAVVLQVDDRVPQGLAVLDIPDVDSIDGANRALAVRLLGAADVWLYVTTAARYADAVPWRLLRVARDRTAEIAIVLNRVSDGDLDEIRPHFEALLASAGLGGVPLFALPETTLVRRMLTREQIAPVRNWLYGLVVDADTREAAVRHTLGGVLRSLPARTGLLSRAAGRQHEAAGALTVCVDRAYAAAVRYIDGALCGGALLTGDVLAQWRAWAAEGLPEATAPAVEDALVGGVESLLRDVVERAAALTSTCWRGRPGGLVLAGDTVEPEREPEDTEHMARAAAEWRAEVAERVPEGMSGPRRASVLLMAAALTDEAGGTDAAEQSRAELPDALAAEVEPLRAWVRARAAEVLNAEREQHLREVRALRTGAGERLHEAMQAARKAG